MEEQRERARSSREVTNYMGADATVYDEIDPSVTTEFTGYDHLEDTSKVTVLTTETEIAESLMEGQKGTIFVEKTPFYATMGGQEGDCGIIKGANGVFEVEDTIKLRGGKYGHVGVMKSGMISNGEEVTLQVNEEARKNIEKNHSATHLLQKALKTVLGAHVEQKGSLVTPDRLRFDFAHFQPMTKEEIEKVEALVNKEIQANLPVVTEVMDVESAKKTGAMALFGEKYGKEVRVVTIGDYSVELCGGTHVGNTSEIGLFKIVKEEGIGSGTRRILAVTGKEAFEAYRDQEDALKAVAATLKAPQLKEVPHKVEGLQEQLRQLQKENAELKEKAAAAAAGDVFKNVQEANGHRYIASQVSVSDAGALRTFADQWKQADYSDVLVLAAHIGEKVNVLVASKSKDVHAGNVIKVLAPIVSGRGGGKPDMAMAGGSDANGIQDLLSAVAEQTLRCDTIKELRKVG